MLIMLDTSTARGKNRLLMLMIIMMKIMVIMVRWCDDAADDDSTEY